MVIFMNYVSSFDAMFEGSELSDHIKKLTRSDPLKSLNFKYVTDKQFNRIIPKHEDCLKFSRIHLNIRSLNSKLRQLCQFLVMINIDFDIIVLLEIWSVNIDCYMLTSFLAIICIMTYQWNPKLEV